MKFSFLLQIPSKFAAVKIHSQNRWPPIWPPPNRRLLNFLIFFLLLHSMAAFGHSSTTQSKSAFAWRDPHQFEPQSAAPSLGMEMPSPLRYRQAAVNHHPFYADAYRLHCHSCMSPYLEDQFPYISHLYRRPMVFTDKCDHGQFDWRYVRSKNCTDACVTLRMNDRVGGRRRFGFMRGCLSDIIHHNRTAVRFGELSRTTKSGATICSAIRLRDLFVSSDRYGFDPHDHVDLCACIRPNCNAAVSGNRPNPLLLAFCLLIFALTSLLRLNAESKERGREIRQIPKQKMAKIREKLVEKDEEKFGEFFDGIYKGRRRRERWPNE